jgi:hypothetical protein
LCCDDDHGLPGETTDMIKSIELVEELKSVATKLLIILMNFVSMRGPSLDRDETFVVKKMTSEH